MQKTEYPTLLSRGMRLHMVRIQQRTAVKRYMMTKRVYRCDRRNVAIAKEFHTLTNSFLDQELAETVFIREGALVIVLTPKSKI